MKELNIKIADDLFACTSLPRVNALQINYNIKPSEE